MTETGTILDKIVEAKRIDLEEARTKVPTDAMKVLAEAQSPPKSLTKALRGPCVNLIAEIKKASPSRGILSTHFDPVGLATAYAENGAAAISVLTETPHFQGSLEDMYSIRTALGPDCPPLLRKDFIFDSYQVLEARAWGADAILLITAILSQDDLRRLLAQARSLGMESLVETHTGEEVNQAISAGAEIMGINNRDLTNFTVDIETTHRLISKVPKSTTVVAESGIFSKKDIAKVASWGVDAVLVGESLMKATNVGAKVRELTNYSKPKDPND